MAVAKIAVSLPKEVLALIEETRRPSGLSRSQFILHAVEAYLRDERARAEAEAYITGYRLVPETPDEIEAADRMGAAVLAMEPWD